MFMRLGRNSVITYNRTWNLVNVDLTRDEGARSQWQTGLQRAYGEVLIYENTWGLQAMLRCLTMLSRRGTTQTSSNWQHSTAISDIVALHLRGRCMCFPKKGVPAIAASDQLLGNCDSCRESYCACCELRLCRSCLKRSGPQMRHMPKPRLNLGERDRKTIRPSLGTPKSYPHPRLQDFPKWKKTHKIPRQMIGRRQELLGGNIFVGRNCWVTANQTYQQLWMGLQSYQHLCLCFVSVV